MVPNKKNFNNYIIVAILILFLGSLGYAKYREYFLPTVKLRINGAELTAEVAGSPKALSKGLGGRKILPEDRAMLFVFSNLDRHSFWMKDMKFAIDIIWIADGKIVDIAPNVQPTMIEPLPTYLPRLPAKLVLETVAGFSSKNNLKIGDTVELLTD